MVVGLKSVGQSDFNIHLVGYKLDSMSKIHYQGARYRGRMAEVEYRVCYQISSTNPNDKENKERANQVNNFLRTMYRYDFYRDLLTYAYVHRDFYNKYSYSLKQKGISIKELDWESFNPTLNCFLAPTDSILSLKLKFNGRRSYDEIFYLSSPLVRNKRVPMWETDLFDLSCLRGPDKRFEQQSHYISVLQDSLLYISVTTNVDSLPEQSSGSELLINLNNQRPVELYDQIEDSNKKDYLHYVYNKIDSINKESLHCEVGYCESGGLNYTIDMYPEFGEMNNKWGFIFITQNPINRHIHFHQETFFIEFKEVAQFLKQNSVFFDIMKLKGS